MEQALLLCGESANIAFAPQPLSVGMTADDSRSGAGHIEQYTIERGPVPPRAGVGCVGDLQLRRQAQPREIAGHSLEPAFVIVECNQFEFRKLREMSCLAAGRGAGIEHSHSVMR